ncbi:MAG: SRPBCC family protein [Acidobacteria bacterium]|nr:SRPBCC family protein [Acidobacteriota bacterium]
MSSTRVTQHVNAPRRRVYRAMLDPLAIARWKVPDGMTCFVHTFEPREGGSFRVSLTYDAPDAAGKSSAHTDTYHGRFVELVPDEKIVEEVEFETSDPAMQGVMTITTTLTEINGGTEVAGLHEVLPPGVSVHDNETGWRMALAKLAALVETDL